MQTKHIVFVASEATPIAKTGGLADVAGALPQALAEQGHTLSIIMPFYSAFIARQRIETTPAGIQLEIFMDNQSFLCPVHYTQVGKVHYYLIEYDPYFGRDDLYGPPGSAYEDNILRFMLFNRAALELLNRQNTPIDIIHCHDWQTAMIPLLIEHQYRHVPALQDTTTVYTIHNLAYQGVFPNEWVTRLGLPNDSFHMHGYEFHHQINCMKAGIIGADAVTTVSQTYAEEILTPEYGCHLEGFLQEHVEKLSGVVNGLDIAQWNPATDKHIAKTYHVGSMAGKKACKQNVQRLCGWKANADTPILCAITRLAEQKGVDLIVQAAAHWLERGCQLIIVGSGDPHLEQQLHQLSQNHPHNAYFYQGFNENIARMVYAGSDIFLMPSRFEPCGLGQLMAMRYGTIPVARATGGLKDTIIDHAEDSKTSTGFLFEHATAAALTITTDAAIETWKDKDTWNSMVERAMSRDSSWDVPAHFYQHLYAELSQ